MKFKKKNIKKELNEAIHSIECGEVDLLDVESDDYEVVGCDFGNGYVLDILSLEDEELTMELWWNGDGVIDPVTINSYTFEFEPFKENLNAIIDVFCKEITNFNSSL